VQTVFDQNFRPNLLDMKNQTRAIPGSHELVMEEAELWGREEGRLVKDLGNTKGMRDVL
jgi:hypothetical protein